MPFLINQDGNKNLVFTAYGKATADVPVIRFEHSLLQHNCKHIKIDQLIYAIEDPLSVFVGWGDPYRDDPLEVPLKGRGTLNFIPFNGFCLGHGHKEEELYLRFDGQGTFFVTFDATKQ